MARVRFARVGACLKGSFSLRSWLSHDRIAKKEPDARVRVACRDEAFAESRERFAELEEWLAGEAAGLQHADLEEQLDVRGRELLRGCSRTTWTCWPPVRCGGMTWPARTASCARAPRRAATRPLVTKFGQVSVSRIAYRSPGRPNVHPLDAALNLPEEKHSHGLRKLAAVEAARGSMEAAGAAVTRATGVTIGKRQLEELARRAPRMWRRSTCSGRPVARRRTGRWS